MKHQEQSVPALRFSEFSGEWREAQIGELLTIGSGKDYKHLEHGDIPVYGTGGYMTSVNDFLYDGNSVGIGRKGTIDKPVFLTGKFWTVDTLFYTHSFQGSTPEFIYLIFQRIDWLKYGEASGVPSLSKTTIEKIKVNVPKPEEQKKIAAFLGAVDKKIAQLQKKKDLLEDYKKGCMQRLFSQSLRFTDANGNTFPDWKSSFLGKHCNITTGSLDANAMVENGKYPFFTCAKNVFRIDTPAFNTEALLVSGNGANVGYIHYYNGQFNAYQRTYVLDAFTLNIQFVKHFLEQHLKKRIFLEVKEGNTPYIVRGTLADMPISYPHLDEQKKIADFLSTIDDKITLVSDELDKAKTFKKGLLQQMFV